MTLTNIQSRFEEIAAKLGTSATLPTKPQPDGSPYAEHVDGKYFYVISERGAEFERRETDDPIELLSWFVRSLTSSLALSWEVKNRVSYQDSRRLYFKKNLELLQGINESWAKQQQAYYDDVLKNYPFNDEN